MIGHYGVEITLKKYNRFIPNLTREDGSAFEKFMDGEAPAKKASARRSLKNS